MPRLDYEIEEIAAISEIVHSRASRSALQKFFQSHCDFYTEKARHSLNAMPNNLHEQAKNNEQAKHYASLAKAYGTMWAEMEILAR